MTALRLAAPAAAILLLLAAEEARPAPQDGPVKWTLPADRAAAFQILEPGSVREFLLFGRELARPSAPSVEADLPLRFLFRAGVGEMKEDFPGLSLRTVGMVRAADLKKGQIEQLFPMAMRALKEKPDPASLQLCEGRHQIFRTRVNQGRTVEERTPAALITTLAARRRADGAVLMGRVQWNGEMRTVEFIGESSKKVNQVRELLLKDASIDVSAAGLAPRIEAAAARAAKWVRARGQSTGRITDLGDDVGSIRDTGLAFEALKAAEAGPDERSVQAILAWFPTYPNRLAAEVACVAEIVEAAALPPEMVLGSETLARRDARERLAGRIAPASLSRAAASTTWLMKAQGGDGLWGAHGSPSVVTTQRALSGLRSAARMGLEVPASVWARALDGIARTATAGSGTVELRIEPADGPVRTEKASPSSWGYGVWKRDAYATCSALVAMAVCRDELSGTAEWTDARASQTDTLVLGGLAWLAEAGAFRSLGSSYISPVVYLDSVMRAMSHLRIRRVDGADWRAEAAALLLAAQAVDGGWPSAAAEGSRTRSSGCGGPTMPEGTAVGDAARAMLSLLRASKAGVAR